MKHSYRTWESLKFMLQNELLHSHFPSTRTTSPLLSDDFENLLALRDQALLSAISHETDKPLVKIGFEKSDGA
jgi:hypothetical protein